MAGKIRNSLNGAIESKLNEFMIEWQIQKQGCKNCILKISIRSSIERVLYVKNYVKYSNATVSVSLNGTFKLTLELLSISTSKYRKARYNVMETSTTVFSIMPDHTLYRKKPYDTFTRDDYIPLLETCPSLASALLPTERDKNIASSQKKITYVGNTKIDGQR